MINLDVSGRFQDSREALRHLWNTLFASENSNFADTANFSKIEKAVLYWVCNASHSDEQASEIRVILKIKPLYTEIPVLVSREKGSPVVRYWDHPLKKIDRREKCTLLFRKFFDWNSEGLRDFRYCEVEILDLQSSPAVSGHLALIESQYIDAYI